MAAGGGALGRAALRQARRLRACGGWALGVAPRLGLGWRPSGRLVPRSSSRACVRCACGACACVYALAVPRVLALVVRARVRLARGARALTLV